MQSPRRSEAEAALMHAQRLDALGRLTGGVAHDFNNLLTVVIGALDVILKHPENAPVANDSAKPRSPPHAAANDSLLNCWPSHAVNRCSRRPAI